jgi:lipopolysaccharide/colanic/teichoic acid biosynthesis glycosyltransferase
MSDLIETPTPYRSKRALDISLAAVALVIAAPVMAIIAIGVRLTSSGPAIHRATRAGQHGVPFTLYKFRSMRTSTSVAGSLITAAGDPRVTKLGRVLRATKLDELPQLVNVLRGQMSIVGPRPEDPSYVGRYSEGQRRILSWRPGLTSPASIAYRHAEAILQSAGDLDSAYMAIADAKIRLDLAYFATSTLRTDVGIIVKTLRSVIT